MMELHRGQLLGMTKEEILEEMERTKWKKNLKTIVKDWRLYVLLLPMVVFFFLFRYLPMVGILIGFRDQGEVAKQSAWDIFYRFDFVGFERVKELIFGAQSFYFWRAFRNTFVLSLYGLIFGFPMPIILALLFSEIKNNLYRSVSQIITYLPKFISTVVISSMVLKMLSVGLEGQYSDGVLTRLLEAIGAIKDSDKSIVQQPQYFRAVYQISGIWEGTGYGSIVYFAAIMSISPTNYEAARIDGANKLQQIRHITLPGVAPTLTIMLILRIGDILNVGYEKVILLVGDTGSDQNPIMETAQVISTYVYYSTTGATGGAAVGAENRAAIADLFNALIAMCLVLGSNFISRRVSNTSLF